MKKWTQMFSGGAAVYVVVAACGSDEVGRTLVDAVDAGADAVAASGGADVAGGSAGLSGLGDASVGAGGAAAAGGTTGAGGGAGSESGASLADAALAVLDAAVDALSAPVAEAQAQSGTRIKVRWQVTDDGAKRAFGFYDSLLDVNCGAAAAPDGVTRCMPPMAPTVFADDTCTTRVGYQLNPSCSGPVPKYASLTSGTGCATVTEVRALGAKVATPAAVYVLSGATCVGIGYPCSPGACGVVDFYEVGAVVSSSEFAQVTEQVE